MPENKYTRNKNLKGLFLFAEREFELKKVKFF